ncbi:MAG: hypothetical protein AAB224_00620 [Gemmatimonadota bacterium]
MDDTRERFLQAIVGRLGVERIVELHLFSPIRQGVMETGVAVVAALPDLPGAEAQRSAEAEAQWSAGEGVRAEVSEAAVLSVSPPDAVAGAVTEAVAGEEALPAPVPLNSTLPLPVHSTVLLPLDFETRTPGEPEDVEVVETPAESRHVVFTAGYRLTRKGPDRGKWSFELAATADAPLATVDMVVRGVMHRSRDLTESERLSGDQLRALLAQPAWRTTP